MARVSGDVRFVDSSGNYEKSDQLKGYSSANKDEDLSGVGYSYYGFIDSDGNWYIQRVNATDIDFCRGTTNYSTNWTGRVAQSYAKYDSVF
jgi:hypothetical protein